MLTIKWFLADSGSTAQVLKNFPIYQGQYANVLLNICVPTSLLAPQFSAYAGNYENVVTPYVAGTAVKVSARSIARNGIYKESKGYYCRYVKTFAKDGIDYALYERKLPKEFTLYSGQGVSAPTIIANVINVEYGDIESATAVSSNSALTVKVDLPTLKGKIVAVSQNYIFTYSTLGGANTWYLNDEVVSLADYGITLIGTPYDSDTITVSVKATTPTVLQVATSQTFPLEVLPSSSLLDNDTAITPTDLALLQSELQAVKSVVADKQDKTDEQLQTSVKTVVGAINGLNNKVGANTESIETHTDDISNLKQEVDGLKQTLATGEHYIGTFDVAEYLPTDDEMSSYVESVMGGGYTVTNGDTVIVTVLYSQATDRNYKYYYTADGWQHYELPLIELANNGGAGLIKGTMGGKGSVLVDIVGGQIVEIYAKDTSGSYKAISYSIKNNTELINKIIDGTQVVKSALQATQDNKGNVIADTYQTAEVGATKLYVRGYSLPRTFNDIYFLTPDGYQTETAVGYAQSINEIVASGAGEWRLLDTTLYLQSEFELSPKNTCDNIIYFSTDIDCEVQLRLVTYHTNGTTETTLASELSNTISFKGNYVQRVDLYSVFTLLDKSIIRSAVGDGIRQELFVVYTGLEPVTFAVWGNETYPTSFNLNTTGYTVYHSLGNLGELPLYELTCDDNYFADDNVQFIGSEETKLYDNVECLVKLTIPTSAKSYNEFSATKEILLTLGGVSVRVASPYNYLSGNARFSQVAQVVHWQDETSGIYYVMKGTMKVSETDGVTFVVDEDDLNDFESYIKENLVDFLSLNISAGSGNKSLQQLQDGSTGTFDFTNKNPNATAIDSTLTGQIAYGGVGAFSTALGGKSSAQGKRSLACGTTTIAKGAYSHAEGDNSVALGADSHAEGGTTVAKGNKSHAEGSNTQSIGDNSHAEGEFTITNAYASHAEGHNTVTLSQLKVPSGSGGTISGGGDTPSKTPDDTLGGYSHTQGDNTQTLGYASHTEGVGTRAWGHYSHAEGLNTIAGKLVANGTVYKVEGDATHAEGHNTTASGKYSHAEGDTTTASGIASHAEGYRTKATGNFSKASGTDTTAIGENSIAEGVNTQANSTNSHAAGRGTKTGRNEQFAIGSFNTGSDKNLFEVGNGTADTYRENAFEVLADGRAKVQTAPIENNDVVRKSDLDSAIGGSGGAYQHLIGIVYKTSYYVYTTIVTSSATPFTATTLGEILRNTLDTSLDNGLVASGTIMADSRLCSTIALCKSTSNLFRFLVAGLFGSTAYYNSSIEVSQSDITLFKDNVIQLS